MNCKFMFAEAKELQYIPKIIIQLNFFVVVFFAYFSSNSFNVLCFSENSDVQMSCLSGNVKNTVILK